jgi:hypothetical protein
MLAGCIKMDEKLTLKGDGGGTLAMSYAMSEQNIAQIQMMQKMAEEMGKKAGDPSGGSGNEATPEKGGAESSLEFDEAKLREKFKKYEQQGVHLDMQVAQDQIKSATPAAAPAPRVRSRRAPPHSPGAPGCS